MTDLSVIASVAIPEGLTRQLRILDYRRDQGLPAGLEFDPAAAAVAARLRAQLRPTTFAIVRNWLNDLVLAGLVPQVGELDALARGVFVACSEFPGCVWNAETLKRALRAFKWFPKPAEVFGLLEPEAEKILDVIRGLDAIAKAPPAERAIPAREPYKLPPAPDWDYRGSRQLQRGRGDHTRPPLNIPPPRRSVAEQIAILTGDGEAA